MNLKRIVFFSPLVLVEGMFTNLPLALNGLILFYILRKNRYVFFYAFISGIFLDTFRVSPLGLRSLFFIVCMFLVLLYEKKFEISTVQFVVFSTFLGGLGYLYLTQGQVFILESFINSLIAGVLFWILKQVQADNRKL